MSKKRLIITSAISIVLVAILLMGSTYSIFTSSDVDEKANVYKTGNLDITYTLNENNIQITNNIPINEANRYELQPYRITVTNNGNVPYMFDLILEDTTASDVIDYQYIMTEVGQLDPKSLSECENNILKSDIIVPANDSVNVDIRIWISDKIQNSEIGKSFYGKLSIDGLAVYDDNTDIDNSIYEALAGYNVRCVTGDNTKYYYDLTTALNEGSTTTTSTCTLLNDITENVSTSVALYDTTIDLNSKTLTGYIDNNSSSSTITLKNGEIITVANHATINNYGTLIISSGIYINESSYVVYNAEGGTATISGGTYTHQETGNTAAIINSADATLTMSGGTITSNSYSFANYGTSVVDGVTMTSNSSTYSTVYNSGTGNIYIYDSAIKVTNSTDYALVNASSGDFWTFDATIYGLRGGSNIIFNLSHITSPNSVEIAVFNNKTITRCGTWTSKDGVDDLVWTTVSTGTTTTDQSYVYINELYSNHNSTIGKYYTDCYNGSTYVDGVVWYWNFDR